MQAEFDDLEQLIALQNIDTALLKVRKQLGTLPQRTVIAEARKKRQAIEPKRAKVAELLKATNAKITKLEDEDARLSAKQTEIQAEIDKLSGDYRSVENRTRELSGIAKRRDTLVTELGTLGEELAKVEAVADQVRAAMATVDAQEASAIEEFKVEGGKLKQTEGALLAQRTQVVSALPGQLATLYEKTAKSCAGIALGKLTDARCSVCRTTLSGGKLLEAKAAAPLATCPNCHRLLIVE